MADGTSTTTEIPIVTPETNIAGPPVSEKSPVNVVGEDEEQIAQEGINGSKDPNSVLELFAHATVRVAGKEVVEYRKGKNKEESKAPEYKIKNVEITFNLGDELSGRVNEDIQGLIDSQDISQKALGIDLRLAWLDQNLPRIEKNWQQMIKKNPAAKQEFDKLKINLALESKALKERRDQLKDGKDKLIPNQVTELAKIVAGDRAEREEKNIHKNPMAFIENELSNTAENTEKTEQLIKNIIDRIQKEEPDVQEAYKDLPGELKKLLSEKKDITQEKQKQDWKKRGKTALTFGGGLGALLLMLGWSASKKSSEQGRQ